MVCKDQGTYSGDAPRLRNNTFSSPSGKIHDIYALYLELEELLNKSPEDIRITADQDEGIIYLAEKKANSIIIKIYTGEDAVSQRKYLEFK